MYTLCHSVWWCESLVVFESFRCLYEVGERHQQLGTCEKLHELGCAASVLPEYGPAFVRILGAIYEVVFRGLLGVSAGWAAGAVDPLELE